MQAGFSSETDRAGEGQKFADAKIVDRCANPIAVTASEARPLAHAHGRPIAQDLPVALVEPLGGQVDALSHWHDLPAQFR